MFLLSYPPYSLPSHSCLRPETSFVKIPLLLCIFPFPILGTSPFFRFRYYLNSNIPYLCIINTFDTTQTFFIVIYTGVIFRKYYLDTSRILDCRHDRPRRSSDSTGCLFVPITMLLLPPQSTDTRHETCQRRKWGLTTIDSGCSRLTSLCKSYVAGKDS